LLSLLERDRDRDIEISMASRLVSSVFAASRALLQRASFSGAATAPLRRLTPSAPVVLPISPWRRLATAAGGLEEQYATSLQLVHWAMAAGICTCIGTPRQPDVFLGQATFGGR
jgi:hypothetical protein